MTVEKEKSDLKGVLTHALRQVFGAGTAVRLRASFFPFTEPSAEIDIGCFNCGGRERTFFAGKHGHGAANAKPSPRSFAHHPPVCPAPQAHGVNRLTACVRAPHGSRALRPTLLPTFFGSASTDSFGSFLRLCQSPP